MSSTAITAVDPMESDVPGGEENRIAAQSQSNGQETDGAMSTDAEGGEKDDGDEDESEEENESGEGVVNVRSR